MNIMDIKLAALDFATSSHDGQVRKYTGEPYIKHPIAVARIVEGLGLSDSAVATAYLHDVVEDCGVLDDELAAMFGEEVATNVRFLTALKPLGMNRANRKALYRAKMMYAPYEVQTIKIADMLHNFPSIIANDPKLAKVWVVEVKAMLGVLNNAHEGLKAKLSNMVAMAEIMEPEEMQFCS